VGDASCGALARDLARPFPDRCLDLTGRTSLPVLAAVLARLSVLVTNDSGPAHIAYAVGTPTITILRRRQPCCLRPA
jgi:ADP-heptose:LPS heptosyltransferase